MTILNRALHKIDQRRSTVAGTDTVRVADGDRLRGWAAGFRRPASVVPLSTDVDVAPAPASPTSAAVLNPPHFLPSTEKSEPAILAPLEAALRVDPAQAPFSPEAVAEQAPVDDAIQAAAVNWPPIVSRLLTCPVAGGLRDLALHLKRMATQCDLRCVAFTGTGRNAGRTSLLLTVACLLAEDPELRLVIVDADFSHPELAKLLSIEPRTGLWDAANGKNTESAITRLSAGLRIAPLVESVSLASLERKQIAGLQSFLRTVRRESDLVLVDAGPWESVVPPLILESRAIDAFLSVCRSSTPHEERAEKIQGAQPGLECLGTVETFAAHPEPTEPERAATPTGLADRLKTKRRVFAS